VSLSHYQLIALPIVACGLMFHPWFSSIIPRTIIALSAVIGTFAYGGFWKGADTGIAVATFRDDSFSSKTRIVRDMIQDSKFYSNSKNIGIRYETIHNEQEARKHLGENKISLLIWGDTKRVRVSINPEPAYVVNGAASFYSSLRGFKLVQTIPAFYLSFSPQQNTADFIGGFISGYIPKLSQYLELNEYEALELDSNLLRIAEMLSRWTSFSHRSVAYFHLATRIIASELRHSEYRKEKLDTALHYLGNASSFLMVRDDPEIKAAVFNNTGILYLMKYIGEGNKEHRKKARKFLSLSKKFLGLKSPFGIKVISPKVAKKNLSILKERIRLERGKNDKQGDNPKTDPARAKKKRDHRTR